MVIDSNIPLPPPPPTLKIFSSPSLDRDKRFDTDLCEITSRVQSWIQEALALKIDVQHELSCLAYFAVNAAQIRDPQTQRICEVVYKQQVIMQTLYCNKVISKITREHLKIFAVCAREVCRTSEEIESVNQLEVELSKEIPTEFKLVPIETMEKLHEKIMTEALRLFQDLKLQHVLAKSPRYSRTIR